MGPTSLLGAIVTEATATFVVVIWSDITYSESGCTLNLIVP